ncbi:glycoside hydrolase family 5 protein [Maribacter sp. 2-571]|uniref:glycoside hydrolase family 5 protein n=1 Tax=Maribacter sp. 2-571 TaxID=3417569 RepID=UPI003D341A36
MTILFKNAVFIFLLPVTLLVSCKEPTERPTEKKVSGPVAWKTYRGVNIGCNIEEDDVADLAISGANLMRLSMPMCTLMNLEPPYALQQNAFQKLDSVLYWAEKHQLSVLIDPHRYPGTKHQWTMLGNDPFWQDFKWHNILIRFWSELAERYADRGNVIAGYDLLNEPEIPIDLKKGSPRDVGLLYAKLTKAIREKDSVHTIVYALPRVYDSVTKKMMGYHKGINLIEIPQDDNRCIETHTYFPKEFTHQNIWEPGDPIPYPSTLNNVEWNKTQLEREQQQLIEFSKDHPNTPILVGEFSCPRWTGEDGLEYLKDVIDIAEKYGWSWAYHSYREASVWDAEMSITDRNDSLRTTNAPRWKLLKDYFKKNDGVR